MALSKKQQQLVDGLNRRVELCREFMNDWLLFNQILSAYPSPGVNKAQLENQFLKVKSKLAREHQVLKDLLLEDYKIDGNTMNIVSGATSLEQVYAASEVAVKKLQTEWHRAFISINETLGIVEDKKVRAEAGEKMFIPGLNGPKGATGGGGGGIELSKNAKTLIVLAIIAVILVVILMVNPGGIADPYRELLGM